MDIDYFKSLQMFLLLITCDKSLLKFTRKQENLILQMYIVNIKMYHDKQLSSKATIKQSGLRSFLLT